MNSFTFNAINSKNYLIMNGKKRSLLPPINRKLIEMPNLPGAYNSGFQFGVRKIEISITILEAMQESYLKEIYLVG
jgi:phage-related protein